MPAKGNNTVVGLDPYRVPCAPSLLTNRTIRRFLNAYSQHTWPEVIKLTLIYGVLGLEQQFPGGTLSIPQLRKLVERGGAQLVVERNLPGLQRQILNLQTNLDAVFDRLAVEPPPAQPAAASVPQPGMLPDAQQRAAAPLSKVSSSRPTSALNPGPVAPKPSDEWRQGEPTGFPSPPRNRSQPLSRSTDNQGATNPIYPDWWLEAGPPPAPAPKQVPRKEPRKQPRLAYSVAQQPKEPSAAVDDLVTAEYLMMPGSGYGQGLPLPVAAGTAPPTMLTSVTADSMHTNPLFEAQQQQQAVAPAAAAAAAVGRGHSGGGQASKGARCSLPVQSKIREAVAASRHKAAAQQQRRQQLLASALAAGSSLFGNTTTATQQGASSSAAAEAAATCASAAAAEQFLSNPWTSCFLQPSALQAGVSGGATEVSDAAAAGEGLPEVLAAEAAAATEEPQQPRAPATYATLRSVVAVSQAAAGAVPRAAGTAGGLPGSTTVGSFSLLQQQQQQQEDVPPAASRAYSKEPARNTAAAVAAPGSSRGVFADITVVLNSQAAAGSAGRQQSSSSAAEDWHDLPVVDEQGQPEQQPQPQQQQQQHRPAWACDYGHLEEVQPPPKPAARQRHAAGKPHKRWSETWVGDFGHLEQFPRFSRDTAFQQEQQQGSGQGGAERAAQPPSKLFMSPADLQALVAAADQLGDQQAEAASGKALASDSAQGTDAQPVAAAEASSAQGLAARLGALLSRWDADTADSASKLPAGMAALAEVSRTAAATAAAASFDSSGAEALADAAPASSESLLPPAGSNDQQVPGQDQDQVSADAGLSAAASDAAELLRELQEAVAEMRHSSSFSTASEGVEATAEQEIRPEAGVLAAGQEAGGPVAAAAATSEASAPAAESHLEGMQETSQMLQQALSRHDALMQLIASLGAAPGSDALLPTAASGSDTTG